MTATPTYCPACHATLDPVMLELSFVCPSCGKRVPAAAMWGRTAALDARIIATDSSYQAFMRGYDETDTLDEYKD